MVEEGRPVETYSAKRQLQILGQTTLEELGFGADYDPLGLATEPLTLLEISYSNSRAKRFLLILHHPFAGEHLAHFLISIAPFKFPGKRGIVDDLGMPIKAMRKIKKGGQPDKSRFDDISLHIAHQNDPVIGPVYNEFVGQNLKRVLRALRNKSADSVFYQCQTIAFARNRGEFLNSFFADCQTTLSAGSDNASIDFIDYTAISAYRRGVSFSDFLRTQSECNQETVHAFEQYRGFPRKQKASLLQRFINQLSKDDKLEFATASAMYRELTLIDLETKQVLSENWHHPSDPSDFTFIDEETLALSNPRGAKANAVPYRDIGFGRIGGKVIHYQFPPDYYASALFPIIAWERSNGTRRFLSQREVNPVLQSYCGSSRWGDVKLGQILGAYLSPQIIGVWDGRMRLASGDYPQRIGGAQTFVWVSITENADQLLSYNNPLFNTLEARA